jgi:hypothetical protein
MTDKITEQEIEVYAMQVAQPDFRIMEGGEPTPRLLKLIGHLSIDDMGRIVNRAAGIAREIAEAAIDEVDRLNEEIRIETFGPDRPDEPGVSMNQKREEIARRMIQRAIDEGRLVRLPSGNLIENRSK